MTNMMAKKNKRRSVKVRRSVDDKVFYAISYSIVIFLTLIVLYPLIYILSCSFSL